MKLTESQHQALYHMTICAVACVDDDTKALAKHGLVEIRGGRFGTWAFATKKGFELARAQPVKAQLARNEEYHRGVTSYAVKHTDTKSVRGSRAASVRGTGTETVQTDSIPSREAGACPSPNDGISLRRSGRRQPANPETQAGSASAPDSTRTQQSEPLKTVGTRVVHTSPVRAPVANVPKTRGATGSTTKSSLRTSASSQPIPNAIRVLIGTKVTYYPLTTEGTLRGETYRVFTVNKLYKSYPVAASAADLLVL